MLNPFYLRVADLTIEVFPASENMVRYCRKYTVEKGPADFSVEVTAQDMENEPEKLALQRKIAEKMVEFDAFLMHGSALAVDGKGYIFTAPSGTGKSTHASLWRELLKDKVVMINDDKPFIRIKEDGVYVYGAPWAGQHRLETNQSVKLCGISIIHQAVENRIIKADPLTGYIDLLQQIYRSNEKEHAKKCLTLLETMIEKVPVYSLYCDISEDAAKMSYEMMKKQ